MRLSESINLTVGTPVFFSPNMVMDIRFLYLVRSQFPGKLSLIVLKPAKLSQLSFIRAVYKNVSLICTAFKSTDKLGDKNCYMRGKN